jgi:sensor domain CHASE-containing protein/signal transduction histidine kinase
MDLRTKILTILGVGIVLVLAGFLVYSSVVLQSSYAAIEHSAVLGDLQRVEFALNGEVADLDSHVMDWAPWDDTYHFTEGNNPRYVEKNLQNDTFQTLDLNYLFIFNRTGGLLSARFFNDTTGNFESVPPAVLDTITRDYPLLQFPSPETDPSVKGVLFVDQTPILIAVAPVLKSDRSGPASGIMIMGRNLDEKRIRNLAKKTGVLPAFDDPGTFSSDPRLQPVARLINKGTPMIIQPENQSVVRGYVALPELNISPNRFLVEISEPRVVFQTGISTLSSFLFITLVVALIFALLGLVILDRMVLSRISIITNDVRRVHPGDEKARIREVPGDDELTELSAAINQMLTQISRIQLRYKSIVEDQDELICRFTPDGTITFMNSAFRRNVKTITGQSGPFSIYDLFRPAVSKETIDAFLPSLTPASPTGSGELGFTFDGLEYTVAWIIRGIFDEEDGSLEYQLVARDITAQRQTEAALQQASRKLSLLNFVTFNEIQNAIFVLAGFLSLMENRTGNDGLDEYIEGAEGSAGKIQDVLTFARQYQNLGIKPPVWQNVNNSFLMGISHLDLTPYQRTVRLDDLEIFADPLLEEVFFTLAGNVVRHGKRATEMTLEYLEKNDGILLFFRDNGIGISDYEKEKIFERGYGKEQAMGLFLVREILSITGISIRETGSFGSGACFEIFVLKQAYRFPDRTPS